MLLTKREAAFLLDMDPKTLVVWTVKGLITTHDGKYDKDELNALKETFRTVSCPKCQSTWVRRKPGRAKVCIKCGNYL